MSGTSKKRKFAQTPNSHSNKHHRHDDEIEQSHNQGRLDPTFGQRSVFPGLDDYTLTGDETLDHDDELGALDYLRSVRQEASTIPTVITAPRSSADDMKIYEDGVGDFRGWYGQGAYTAAPLSTTSESDEPVGRDPQTMFYESLKAKYQDLRARLNQTPPEDIREKLDLSLYPIHARQTKEGVKEWNLRLRNNAPNPVQLALMNKWSVLRLLSLLTTEDAVIKKGLEINENTSLWLWGLLARVPERGEMSSEQIAIVRELGKKAALVRLGFQEAEDWNDGLDAVEAEMRIEADYEQEDEEEKADTDKKQRAVLEKELQSPPPSDTADEISSSTILTTDPGSDELAASKARLLSALNAEEQDTSPPETDPSGPSRNTKVTLDMILTVAGDVYGQRDILEFREKWDEVEPLGTY